MSLADNTDVWVAGFLFSFNHRMGLESKNPTSHPPNMLVHVSNNEMSSQMVKSSNYGPSPGCKS